MHIDLDNILLKDRVQHGRGSNGTSKKGKFMHSVELLSSDHSSDDGIRQSIKSPKKKLGKQIIKNGGNSNARSHSLGVGTQSPSRSPESSHVLAYSYEEDTNSHGAKSPGIETTLPKLRRSDDVGDVQEVDRKGKSIRENATHLHSESQQPNGRKVRKGDISPHEGDESDEEEDGRNEIGSESDDEELAVYPKVPVKRKLMSEPKDSEKRSQRGRPKSTTSQVKKPRTPQIDASVIMQLEFGRRPVNSVSTAFVIFLHDETDLCVEKRSRLGSFAKFTILIIP